MRRRQRPLLWKRRGKWMTRKKFIGASWRRTLSICWLKRRWDGVCKQLFRQIMDPLTHIFLTRKLISKRPLAIIAGVAPDAPFYLTYPAWVIRQGQLKHALQTNDWPDPPVWMETSHHMFHSLPLLFITALLLWTVSGRIPRHIFLAWVLHILIDIPTHSRRRWGPRFLWPISTYSFDGLSWAEAALQLARSSSGDASLEID